MKVEYTGEKEFEDFRRGVVYPVMGIERGWYRIFSECMDDYLYPPEWFKIVEGSIDDVPKSN